MAKKPLTLPAKTGHALELPRAFKEAPKSINQGRPRAETSGSEMIVHMLDYIYPWGFNAEDFISELASADVDTITLRINSGGGLAYDGIAIYNALVMHKATVNIEVLGLAASAASFVALAGDSVKMGKGAEIMIHMPSNIAFGTADDFVAIAEQLRVMEQGFIDAYTERSTLDRDEIEELLRAETFFSAKRAIEIGLADGMLNDDADETATASANKPLPWSENVMQERVAKLVVGTDKERLSKLKQRQKELNAEADAHRSRRPAA